MTDDIGRRVESALGNLLALQNIRPQCPGMACATQMLRIGSEEICTDEVLIEEAHYDSMDQMATEITSLTIKMGMFSPFERRSTYPPKYFFAGEHTPVTYFVTSVPQVSLAAVLEEMNRKYPPHYTWDRIGFIRDRIRTMISAYRQAWVRSKNPLRLVAAVTEAVRNQQPQGIGRHERMQLAAFLAVSVRQKHTAGIFHNNINIHTIFFSDALSPRLLNNYSGVTPFYAPQYTPAAILSRRTTESTFGEQSADVYALAQITYRLLLGEELDGCAFRLEEPQDLPAVPTIAALPHRSGWLSAFNGVIDLLNESAGLIVRLKGWMAAVLDTSKWPRFRRLCRASGALVYSIPVIGPVLCICFPPRTAVVLRAILDRQSNDEMFNTHAHTVRSSGNRRNAECSFLLSGLSEEWFHRTSRIARLIAECLDNAKLRPVETADDDRTAISAPVRSRIRHAVRGVGAVFLLCLTFLLYDSDALRPLYGHIKQKQSAAVGKKAGSRTVQKARSMALASPHKERDRITQKLISTKKTKTRQVIPQQRRVAESISEKQQQTLKELAREKAKQPCGALLESVHGYRSVYKVKNFSTICRAGDLRLMGSDGPGETLLEQAEAESKWFLIHPKGTVLSDIIDIRLCRYSDDSHIEGRFYEAIGTQGMGREIPVQDGDLFAFSWLVLNRYKNKQ